MPSYVIKPDPDLDQYVYWSEVVEAPLIWGTRSEVAEKIDFWKEGPAEPRMVRADNTGTSAMWPNWVHPQIYSWDMENRTVIYEQKGTVQISQLWEFCERLGREESVEDLIEPFEREDEDE